jgi:hypothetical protein
MGFVYEVKIDNLEYRASSADVGDKLKGNKATFDIKEYGDKMMHCVLLIPKNNFIFAYEVGEKTFVKIYGDGAHIFE